MSKNFSDLSPKQLRDAAVLKEKIEGLQAQLNRLLGEAQSTTAKAPVKKAGKKKRTMSPEARAKIAAAQRKRWQKQKKQAAS